MVVVGLTNYKTSIHLKPTLRCKSATASRCYWIKKQTVIGLEHLAFLEIFDKEIDKVLNFIFPLDTNIQKSDQKYLWLNKTKQVRQDLSTFYTLSMFYTLSTFYTLSMFYTLSTFYALSTFYTITNYMYLQTILQSILPDLTFLDLDISSS